jgi:hypothetical protein
MNSFILYVETAQHVELLSDEDAGRLFKAIFAYAKDGTQPTDLPPAAAMAFSFIRAYIDANSEKWAQTREKRSAAGRKGAAVTNGKPAAKSANAEFAESESGQQQQPAAKSAVSESASASASGSEFVSRNRADTPPARSRFVAPSVEEIRAYCLEHHIDLDAATFVDYYTAKGWRIGNSPMKDWKAAARTWARRDRDKTGAAPTTQTEFSNVPGVTYC